MMVCRLKSDEQISQDDFFYIVVKNGKEKSIGFTCCSAQFACQQIQLKMPLSIIVTSGTLAPFENF